MLYLCLQAADLSQLRVCIDHRLVLDLPRPVRVPQRVDRLLHAIVGRGHAGKHHCVGVAAEGVCKY